MAAPSRCFTFPETRKKRSYSKTTVKALWSSKSEIINSYWGGGASTSRLPFDCGALTTPVASISSIMRAARL